jgi:DNA polymerase-3 subunit alpha
MKQLVAKLKPSRFEDIIALVALFRPGPLGSGMVDDFVERKHGRQEIVYPLPQLEDILKETYGVILYQEQVQKTAVVLANYTPGEADMLRRAMGKKIKAEMDAQKERFLKGATENKLDPEKAGQIFDLMAKFAEYGFNKSHSAAYGLIAYQTAYLKTKFPELFMAAIMTCDLDNTDKVINYAQDCLRMKMTILPPDINHSALEFTVPSKWTIRWGLAAIKGIGAASIQPLVIDRTERGPYKSLFDMARRVDLHATVGKKTMELLIKTGAMDIFGLSREHMLGIIGDVVKYSETHFTAKKHGQRSLFDFGDEQSSQDTDDSQDAQPHWLGVIGKSCPISLESLEEERKLTGMYLTGHPMDFYQADVKRFSKTTLVDAPKLASLNGKDKIHLVCIFQSGSVGLSKKDQKPRAFITLEDRTAKIEAMMFEKDIPQVFPTPGTPVCVQGSIRKLPDGTVTRMKLERILSLEEVRQHHVKSFTVSVDLRQGVTTEETEETQKILQKISALTSKNKGPARLRIEINYPQSKVALAATNGVELTNELVRAIRVGGLDGRYE